jgi:hypothetical protein
MGIARQGKRKPLHEATRRALCRLAFVLLALLPVLCAFTLSALEFVPAYQRARAVAWQRELSRQLGVGIEIASVELRSPERLLLHGVKVLDPETRAVIARVPQVDWVQGASGVAVRLHRPEVQAGQLSRGWWTFHEQFLCRPAVRNQVAVVILEQVTVRGAVQEDLQLSQVRIEGKWTPEQATLTASLQWAGQAEEAPAQLRLARWHASGRQATQLELASGSAPIPCRLASQFCPEVSELGPAAGFLGDLTLRLEPQRWQVRTKGHFTALDCGQFTDPAQLAGSGQLWLADLVADEGGLRSVHGQLFINEGRISHKLLLAASAYMHVQLAQEVLAARVNSHAFEQLALDFDLDARGLQISGLLQHSADGKVVYHPGTIVADRVGTLAAKSPTARVPLGQAIVALSDATLAQPLGQTLAADIIQSPMGRRLVRILPAADIDQAVSALRTADRQASH